MAPHSATKSRVPGFIGFPLAVIITLGTSAGLYSAAAELTGFELSTVSRTLNEPWQIFALVGWRIAELYSFWVSGFDSWDVASVTLLTLTPYHSFLPLFYSISPFSVLTSAVIDLVSSVLPFLLLRPLAPYNDPPSSAPASTQLSSSTGIKFFVTGFLTVTYAVTIFTSLQTFLPSYIVSQFDVQTLEPAHAVTFFILLAALLPLGNAARSFLYTPSTFLARTAIDEKEFDPITGTLGETVAHNIGISDWGKRETILIRRTAYLTALTIGTSIAKIYGTVEGAELAGSIGWGGVWAATGVLSCVGLVYIGDA